MKHSFSSPRLGNEPNLAASRGPFFSLIIDVLAVLILAGYSLTWAAVILFIPFLLLAF